MKVFSKIVSWLAPSWAEELKRADAGVVAAQRRLNQVQGRDHAVRAVVQAHRIDRSRNRYGERIRRALEGGPL